MIGVTVGELVGGNTGLGFLISYAEGQANAAMVFNAIIATSIAFFWSGLSALIEEPFKWATGMPISLRPALLDYPYLMLWLLPLLSMCCGWLALKAGMPSLSRTVGAFPIFMLAMILGWYYLTPISMH